MISNALKLIRKYHNMSQTQLAGKLALSTSYLSELESGKKEPSIDILQRYSEHFNVPLSSLVVFSETIDGKQNESKAKAFISKKMLRILEWVSELDDTTKEQNQKLST